MTSEERLKSEGWEKKLTIDEPRLSEAVEAYKEIGFEVHLEPFHPEEESSCTVCMQGSPEKFKTIYTRMRS